MPPGPHPFGQTSGGQTVHALRIASDRLQVTLLTLGAAIQDVRLAGVPYGLTLGGPDLAAYLGPMGYFGTIVGPVANRIGQSRAVIGGRTFHFPPNTGTTLLHGGETGTHSRIWSVEHSDPASATLALSLPDGDGGFPGNRRIVAAFTIRDAALTLELTATTDAPTLMNLANHSYWNLDDTPTTAGQALTVLADTWLPSENDLPTGEQRPVSGAFDLHHPRRIDGTEGYDHNFCLAPAPRSLTHVATLRGAAVTLEMDTTEPGLQVYDGRGLDTAPFPGHSGRPYGPYAGLALEAQRWPDAPNHPGFPPVTLDPGETYSQVTRWRFARS